MKSKDYQLKPIEFQYETLSRTRLKYLLNKYLHLPLHTLTFLDNNSEVYENMWSNVYKFLRSEISAQTLYHLIHGEDYGQDPTLQSYLDFTFEVGMMRIKMTEHKYKWKLRK